MTPQVVPITPNWASYPSINNALPNLGLGMASSLISPGTANFPQSQYTEHCFLNATSADLSFWAVSGTFSLVTPSPTVVLLYPLAGSTWQVRKASPAL
jgi:hypothetical protein